MVAISILILMTVFCSVLLHFECLIFLSGLARAQTTASRSLVLKAVFGVLAIHVIEIGVHAMTYWIGDIVLDVGGFSGPAADDPLKYVYFSLESFTALGMGDVYPTGALRIVAGAEALNGLLLIAWSASFTFMFMQKFWKL